MLGRNFYKVFVLPLFVALLFSGEAFCREKLTADEYDKALEAGTSLCGLLITDRFIDGWVASKGEDFDPRGYGIEKVAELMLLECITVVAASFDGNEKEIDSPLEERLISNFRDILYNDEIRDYFINILYVTHRELGEVSELLHYDEKFFNQNNGDLLIDHPFLRRYNIDGAQHPKDIINQLRQAIIEE